MAPILHKHGWSPLPLPPGKKAEPPDGWTGYHDQWPSYPDVQAWIESRAAESNTAIRMPKTVLGIDVDAYDAKPGGATLAELESNCGPLPPTWTITSRTDGVSGIKLFRIPAGYRSVTARPGIEFLQWFHRYAVGPGSVHPSGAVYQLFGLIGETLPVEEMPTPDELPELPPAWLAELASGQADPTPSPANGDNCSHSVDPSWLDHAPGGEPCRIMRAARDHALDLPGTGRHDHMTARVLDLVRLGSAGHPGVSSALGLARDAFVRTVSEDRAGGTVEATAEFERAVTGAAAKVPPGLSTMADPCTITAEQFSGTWLSSHAADRAGSSGAKSDPVLALLDAREELARIRDFAWARITAPMTTLGCVLMRIAASTPPRVVLPPIVGGKASLNQFCGLVAAPGMGKGGADSIAEEMLILPEYLHSASPGSGEGIVHQFVRRGKDGAIETYRDRALFQVSEVDTLNSLGKRQGSTLMSQLRSVWSGESLGHAFADPAKALIIRKHSYRLCLIIGIQPGRAGPLLLDVDAGTPQRILWLSGVDPHQPDIPPPEPRPWKLPYIEWTPSLSKLGVPTPIWQEIRDAHRQMVRGKKVEDPYAGHLRLTRLKVAQTLSILAGRPEMNMEDWELAGVIIDISENTRLQVLEELHHRSIKDAEREGVKDAARTAAAEDGVNERNVKRVSQWIMRTLPKNGLQMKHRDLRNKMANRDRKYLKEAIDRLVMTGLVDHQTSASGGVYSLARPVL